MIENSILAKKYPEMVKTISLYYNEHHRYHHNWNHIREGFELFSKNKDFNLDLTAELAWYFHDIVYLPFNINNGLSNENLSAQFLEFFLHSNYPDFYFEHKDEIENAKKIILGTEIHKGFDDRSNFIFDVDLYCLSTHYNKFLEYRQLIREEYSWLSEEDFVNGTLHFYDKILKEEYIFNSAFGIKHWEKRARKNLEKNKEELKEFLKQE